MADSYKCETHLGMAIDPIHVGTGGAGLGRVDNAIVRDPVTPAPKIPGSSLAGVLRTYAAMAEKKFADCAGLGQPRRDGSGGHCGKTDCSVCTVFGFARGNAGGFAGLAAFSDAHVLLFPVATREGPVWLTCPTAMRGVGEELDGIAENALYRNGGSDQAVNLGWLLLPVKRLNGSRRVEQTLEDRQVPKYIFDRAALLPDKLFSHVVNSNLEVRTSVAINPETGAAEDRALFTYEALPRATVLVWDVTCKNPAHFKTGGTDVTAVKSPDDVHRVVVKAHPYLEHLGIGGMGTRGIGRLRVLIAAAA
ncbi:MAG: type III-B CRISPR module RAMP protein Cmr4 [Candidatus Binataceae bacterium]